MRSRSDDLPPGYTEHHLGGGNWMLMPMEWVRPAEEESDTEAPSAQLGSGDRRSPAQTLTGRGRNAKKPDVPSASSDELVGPKLPATWAERWGSTAPAGQLRVVLDHQALCNGSLLGQRQLRSADTDVGTRTKALFEQLARRSPDRRVARPPNWGEALRDLERELPHFRGPLRLLTQSLALAEVAAQPTRIPPMLLLGPPGVGKTYFSQKVAELLGAPHATLSFDQPGSGSSLRGSDKYWGNSHYGLLFEQLCLGDCANPVILLDELDKGGQSGSNDPNPIAQLHGALEPVTARRINDVSLDLSFDASLVTYIATANSLRGIDTPVLSRFEVFYIEPPAPREAMETARCITRSVLERLGLGERLRFDPKGYCVLAHLSPRLMQRTVEKSVGAAIAERRDQVREQDLWAELGFGDDSELH